MIFYLKKILLLLIPISIYSLFIQLYLLGFFNPQIYVYFIRYEIFRILLLIISYFKQIRNNIKFEKIVCLF